MISAERNLSISTLIRSFPGVFQGAPSEAKARLAVGPDDVDIPFLDLDGRLSTGTPEMTRLSQIRTRCQELGTSSLCAFSSTGGALRSTIRVSVPNVVIRRILADLAGFSYVRPMLDWVWFEAADGEAVPFDAIDIQQHLGGSGVSEVVIKDRPFNVNTAILTPGPAILSTPGPRRKPRIVRVEDILFTLLDDDEMFAMPGTGCWMCDTWCSAH